MNTQAGLLVLFAGLAGAAGVALAAMGAHGGDTAGLTTPAHFLIMHAAAALGAVAVALRADRACIFLLAGFVMLVGVTLFSGDIAMRTLSGDRLFPMAAPIGGSTMMLGWALVGVAALRELFARRA
ncbi:DUF423 domain-containing protein [Hyphomicrobium sp. D-2]|uniref:DUF423 domain-containing protein n=1 Tax=Hyphomicrobium sp. D-2 TaxID=3041621 RepID=UPI002454A2ED|nr:DUF423 domain-containing protein [Hyphomicrobium sp. D-2]MDH4982834.1 DUF423 domain-containing protein [Hyphomicrobium sp. D-2]